MLWGWLDIKHQESVKFTVWPLSCLSPSQFHKKGFYAPHTHTYTHTPPTPPPSPNHHLPCLSLWETASHLTNMFTAVCFTSCVRRITVGLTCWSLISMGWQLFTMLQGSDTKTSWSSWSTMVGDSSQYSNSAAATAIVAIVLEHFTFMITEHALEQAFETVQVESRTPGNCVLAMSVKLFTFKRILTDQD